MTKETNTNNLPIDTELVVMPEVIYLTEDNAEGVHDYLWCMSMCQNDDEKYIKASKVDADKESMTLAFNLSITKAKEQQIKECIKGMEDYFEFIEMKVPKHLSEFVKGNLCLSAIKTI